MKLAGTWIFIHQLCSAGTSGWIAAASVVELVNWTGYQHHHA
jgi:hypothetical protein